MYTESELRELYAQQCWLLFPALLIGVASLFAYMGLLAFLRGHIVLLTPIILGKEAQDWIMLPLVLPSVAFFLIPLGLAEHWAKQYSIICPNCNEDLTRRYNKILKTRCCDSCDKRILKSGKVRDERTFSRYCRRQWRRYLVYWFWSWPFCAVLVFVSNWYDPTAFNNCPQMLFMFGLVGTVATGWALIRTKDWRYFMQAIVSCVCFMIGIHLFLH